MSTMTSVAGAGAGLMYVLDPVAGSRRRALARDQLGHAGRRVTEATGTILRDAQNRGRGLKATLVRELRPGDVPDHVLEDRARSRLGTLVRYPRLVHVRCENGPGQCRDARRGCTCRSPDPGNARGRSGREPTRAPC
jgi:hypothetical protein